MNKKEILDGIQSQIVSFDNKASILLSVVGIVFALALSFLDVFHAGFYIEQSKYYQVCYCIFFVLFIIVAIAAMVCYVLVILPRRNKTQYMYGNYYLDICQMSKEELVKIYSKEDNVDDCLLGQIIINSQICSKKHKYILAGIVLLIPFGLLLIALILLTICG